MSSNDCISPPWCDQYTRAAFAALILSNVSSRRRKCKYALRNSARASRNYTQTVKRCSAFLISDHVNCIYARVKRSPAFYNQIFQLIAAIRGNTRWTLSTYCTVNIFQDISSFPCRWVVLTSCTMHVYKFKHSSLSVIASFYQNENVLSQTTLINLAGDLM